MSEKFIPEHIDPYRYAEQNLQLKGTVKLADMQRLSVNLNQEMDKADVDLHFGIDEQGLAYLKGRVTAKLKLQCQRCMEPFIYEIMSDFALGIVNTLDEANALPDQYEPALAKDGQLALRELIEDELILNLPIIPRHAPDACKVQLPVADSGWEQDKAGESPFHVLESLKKKKES